MGTYTAVILTIFLHCRPLHKNWQVYPDPGRKDLFIIYHHWQWLILPVNCSADYVNYIVIAVTNVTYVFLASRSDMHILTVPVPTLSS